MRYWAKKYHRSSSEKVVRVNKRKKKVAETKLRVKGKFVTLEQAIKLVGKR
jgi:transposase-like protein